jgi:hypothetical protein
MNKGLRHGDKRIFVWINFREELRPDEEGIATLQKFPEQRLGGLRRCEELTPDE